MRPSYLPSVKVPKPYDKDDMNCYSHNRLFRDLSFNGSFKFRYDINYPKGKIFSGRKCHLTYMGYCHKRGLFQEKSWLMKIHLAAYPSSEDKFDGFVNVVDLKARIFDGKECVDAEIYEDKRMKVFELHNMIVEAVAGTDDELLEKFFMGETLTNEEIHRGLRKGVLDGELIPVLVGSATKNIGIHTMLDMFIDYLPSPNDLKPYVATDLSGKTPIIELIIGVFINLMWICSGR